MITELKFSDLKDAVKVLNSMNIEGLETIRTVGISREKMEGEFLNAVAVAVDNGLEDELSDEIVDINNFLAESEDEGDVDPDDEGDDEGEGEVDPDDEGDEDEPVKKAPSKKAPAKKETAKKEPAKKEPAKKEPAKKEPAKKKANNPEAGNRKAERSCYDHIKGAKTGIIDEMLREGSVVANIMKKAEVNRVRVMAHIKYLRETCGLTVLFTESTKGDNTLDHYKIKEKEYRKP